MFNESKSISNLVKDSSNTTLTLSIDGPYFPLTKFRKALDGFIDLLTEIDKETSDTGNISVEWELTSIKQGSWHISTAGNPMSSEADQSRPCQIIQLFREGISQLQDSPVIPIGFTEAALRYTKVFGELINPNDFADIKFRNDGWTKTITPRLSGNIDEIRKSTYKFYGSLEGKLVSINVAGKQKIGIRSSIEEKTIQCYFNEDMFDIAKQALGQRVYVFGLIRQRLHGSKINIKAEEIKILPSRKDIPDVNEILSRLRIVSAG